MDSQLNEEQLSAIEHREGPILVIAGAGTGKTSVITERIARLIKGGVNPSEILALTFTDKAAAGMEERVDRLVPYGYSTVWLSTFHSFGDRVLRDNALSIGLTPDFKVLNTAETIIFLREHLFELPLDYYRPSGDPTKYLSALVRFIARLKDEDISPQEYLAYAESVKEDGGEDYLCEQRELAEVYKKYSCLMEENGYIDFGDQVGLPLKLFRKRCSILKRYMEKFSYILVDEFQDTNYAQFELVKLLGGEKANIMVVADDDQSIYKFRGAAVSNVLGFLNVYKDAKIVTLTKNYRSTQPILDAAYRLIVHNNPDRLEVKSGINKKLASTRDDKESAGVRHTHRDTLSSEAEFVANSIADYVKEGRYNLRDFSVLVRANSDAEPFLRALSNRGIRYKFSGSSGLYAREEVSFVICFLRVITNPMDNLSLFHLATSPIYKVAAEDMVILNNAVKRRHVSLFKAMKDAGEGGFPDISEEGKDKFKRLIHDIGYSSEMALKETTGAVLYHFLMETGYIKILCAEETEENEERIRNISRFFEITARIEEGLRIKNPHTLVGYFDMLVEAGDDPPTVEPDTDADCVHVLTVHKAKGLEFPVVFMVSLVSERFPRKGRGDLIEVPAKLIKDMLPSGDFHLEEERRLFYVGMTRAKDILYLTSAADYGGSRAKKISRFVLEALDTPKAATVKTNPKEAIERFAPLKKGEDAPLPLPRVSNLGAPSHLSYYQIDDYITCPLKYKYAHIFKVPLLPHHTIMYGKAIHDAIACYFRKKSEGEKVSEEELVFVFKSSWRQAGFISKEHEEIRFNEGVSALKEFLKKETSNGIKPAAIEKSFSAAMGRFVIAGRWDLIEDRKDGPYIIDFKTSDVRDKEKADERAKKSLQLKLYALAYREQFGRLPQGCELYFVNSGIMGVAIFDEKDMNSVIEIIEKVSDGIKARDFRAAPKPMNCRMCAFNNICPEKAG